ncbi:MAG: aspartate carbamoyltransferase regulatory subunit [Euryarchaeota archaeon]|nr:aspartate carbamoyltransferase regulatory subunit [Euryarchaeota archaeon]
MKEFIVPPIRNGTVIDHIPPGKSVRVLEVLGIPRPGSTSIVSLAMNVETGRGAGRKDIVKIEDRELEREELDRIALIAPGATINIIRNYDVARKHTVDLPDTIEGVVQCQNPDCVTLSEPVASRFQVTSRDPLVIRCDYCRHVLSQEAVA